jgi:hypothetical protein
MLQVGATGIEEEEEEKDEEKDEEEGSWGSISSVCGR